ncbi:phenylalanine--tRNA ligase beta subunit-related protein [Actinacidiphila glaucinigra]|uniref:phenylalanine--tRNA ligase beta subunit-related protein n=1 Tax=Actinacidiphila glaucinigra TaxID=235986 RepID=UPI0035DE0C53
MTTLDIDQSVLELCADVTVALAAAYRVDDNGTWVEAETALADLEAKAAAGAWIPQGQTDARITTWHSVCRSFGSNPRRIRPSVNALFRRLTRTRRFPCVDGPVDAYNSVPAQHVLPVSAFNLETLHGEILLRVAGEKDLFILLGKPEAAERPGPREKVYADSTSVLTWHCNHRDAESLTEPPTSRAAQVCWHLLNPAHVMSTPGQSEG